MDVAIAFFRREQILEEEKKRLRGSVETCSIHGAVAGSETFTLRFADYETYNKWQDKMLSLSDPPTGATLEYHPLHLCQWLPVKGQPLVIPV